MSQVLICCDKFKGSATSAAVSQDLAKGLEQARHTVSIAPLADGGDGTLEAFDSLGYQRVSAQVHDSSGDIITAEYALSLKSLVLVVWILLLRMVCPPRNLPCKQAPGE